MASNSFGEIFRMTSFGESHGPALGVVIDGVPANLELSTTDIRKELARRRPGQSTITTARTEADDPEILSGVFEGRTTGGPIAVIVRNRGQRPEDYDALRHRTRPGHADQAYALKYGHRDHRGGGRSSGRETLARVIAGTVARKVLGSEVSVIGHAVEIGPHRAKVFDQDAIEGNPVRCADPEIAGLMSDYISDLRANGDSCGGVVEIRIQNPPPSLGDPTFSKLKAQLADAVMSVGAVTGFSYGAGFRAAGMLGSEYVSDPSHFGGILGGISTGETIDIRASVKPTSSIGDVAKQGRHDPCIVPRVIPVLEAMVAIVLADRLLYHRALHA